MHLNRLIKYKKAKYRNRNDRVLNANNGIKFHDLHLYQCQTVMKFNEKQLQIDRVVECWGNILI